MKRKGRTAAVKEPKSVGEYLRSLRLARGLSQREVADALGVDASTISRLETGKLSPPAGFAERLSEALSLSQDEYIGLVKLFQNSALVKAVRSPVKSLPEQLSSLPSTPMDLYPIQSLLARSALSSPRLVRAMRVDPEEKNALGHFLGAEIVEICDPNRINPLIFDSGTTCAFIAYHLGLPAPYGLLDVYTSNLLAALSLAEKSRVYLIGGRLDSEFGATLGSESIDQMRKVLEYLNQQPLERVRRPIALLACLAFSPREGPYARKQDLPNARQALSQDSATDVANRSRHMRMKQLLISYVPDLILPITSEKLLRPQLPAWKSIAAPVDSDEYRGWQLRLAGAHPRNAFTHLVFSLPASGLAREHVLRAVQRLINDPLYPFTVVQTLFGRLEETAGNARFLTVFDLQSFRPLSKEELLTLL